MVNRLHHRLMTNFLISGISFDSYIIACSTIRLTLLRIQPFAIMPLTPRRFVTCHRWVKTADHSLLEAECDQSDAEEHHKNPKSGHTEAFQSPTHFGSVYITTYKHQHIPKSEVIRPRQPLLSRLSVVSFPLVNETDNRWTKMRWLKFGAKNSPLHCDNVKMKPTCQSMWRPLGLRNVNLSGSLNFGGNQSELYKSCECVLDKWNPQEKLLIMSLTYYQNIRAKKIYLYHKRATHKVSKCLKEDLNTQKH